MTRVLTDQSRTMLEAPLRVEKPAETIGRAMLLYVALVTNSSFDGLIIRRTARLAEDLSVTEAEIEAWLQRLSEAKLIEIVSPSPYLTARLRFWPSNPSFVVEKQAKPGDTGNPAEPAAAATAINKQQQQGVGGLGEGENLEAEVTRVLGAPDASEVADLLARHPATLVRKVLAEVQKTPAHRIRKSRLALFRFLLAKFSSEIDVNEL